MTEMRVDKWLWAARFFKSRTLAAAACDGGKVDVNDQGGKPSRMVRPGDRLTIMSFTELDLKEAKGWEPRVIVLDEQNNIVNERGI